MSVIRCIRCEQFIDMNYNPEVFTNEQIPGLAKNDFDWVCFDCLTDEEYEVIE